MRLYPSSRTNIIILYIFRNISTPNLRHTAARSDFSNLIGSKWDKKLEETAKKKR